MTIVCPQCEEERLAKARIAEIDTMFEEAAAEIKRLCDMGERATAALNTLAQAPSERQITLKFTEQELAVVQELADYHQLSQLQTMRQALRLYQLHNRRIRDGESLTWSGDARRAEEFAGLAMPSASRATPCDHAAIISLDGKWHCQKCGDAIDMAVAHTSTQSGGATCD